MTNVASEVSLPYPAPLRDWNLHDASLYAVQFARSFEYSIASYIKNDPSGLRLSLADTVFVNLNWMALYRVVIFALSSYRYGRGLPCRDGLGRRNGPTKSIVYDLPSLAVAGMLYNHAGTLGQ